MNPPIHEENKSNPRPRQQKNLLVGKVFLAVRASTVVRCRKKERAAKLMTALKRNGDQPDMKSPIHNNNKTKKCPGQQKKHPGAKNSPRSRLKSPKSVRCRSKFSRSELFAKRDIIHNSPYCPDIIKNISSPAAVLCWFVLQSVLRHCKRDSCLSRNQVQMSMVELGNRAGVSLRATQMGVGCLCDNGVYAVDQVKQTGHLSWRNDPRGNIFTLLDPPPPPLVHPYFLRK